jgi:hypothetical protein
MTCRDVAVRAHLIVVQEGAQGVAAGGEAVDVVQEVEVQHHTLEAHLIPGDMGDTTIIPYLTQVTIHQPQNTQVLQVIVPAAQDMFHQQHPESRRVPILTPTRVVQIPEHMKV